MIFVLTLGGLVVLLLSGIPIFAALALAGSAILFVFEGSVESIADTVFSALNNGLLLTIPLFVFMAQVMMRAGVVDDLFQMANTVIGHIRGGLGVATVLSCTIFAAISGSSVATALSIGTAAIPQMKRYGYPERNALGVVAAGGTLGILIPPSGPMILYAVVSDSSIGALFLAGIVPGILLALIFAGYCMVVAGTKGSEIEKKRFAGWSPVMGALKRSFFAVMMPPVVMGGIYLGVFTASEAAAVGCLYALLVAVVVYRKFSLRDFGACLVATLNTTMMVLAIIAAAAIFSHAITIIRLPAIVAELIVGWGLGELSFLLVVMAMIFVLGMFLESIAIILITTPIILPTMIALDINPVWYGVMLMINLELAMITPPVGMNLFVIKGITDAPLAEVIRGSTPYVLLMIAGLLAVLFMPQLALLLPAQAGFRM